MSTAAIKLKKSSTVGKVPLVGDIAYGEPALNYADGRLFYKNSSNAIKNFIDSDLIQNRIAAATARTFVTYEYLASNGQTTFANSDLGGTILAYDQNRIIVSLNGVILQPGQDYTATSGTSIVLDSATVANDVLQVTAFDRFTVADTVRASTGGTFSGPITATSFTGAGTGLTGITSSNLSSAQQLIIYNSAGAAVKTLYGTGS